MTGKYLLGEIVVVKDNILQHRFEIGQKVKVFRLDDDGTIYSCISIDGKRDIWCVNEDEEIEKFQGDVV